MPSLRWILLFSVISSIVGFTCGKKLPDIRLPTAIVPEHYDIGIVPDIDQDSLEGLVVLDFFVRSSTDQIFMHAKNLRIVDSSVVVFLLSTNNTQFELETLANDVSFSKEKGTSELKEVFNLTSYDSEREFVIFNLFSKLQENGKYRLSFNYTGKLATNLKGIYRSEYVDKKTQTKK